MIWLRTYARTHMFYIILIVGGVFAFHVWLQEHDARVAADNVVKQQETVVANLTTQIAATQAQAAVKVNEVKRVVKKATTPSEVVTVLPQLTNLPLNARPVSPTQVEVDAEPLVQLAGEAKVAEVQLAACQQVSVLKDQQIVAKDAEIVALKKKPRFLTRVKHVAEAVGVGIAIGFVLAKK